MSKPLNDFGGWLSFCRLSVMLSLIFIIIELVLVLIVIIAGPFIHIANLSTQDTVSLVIGMSLSLILVIIQINILKILKNKISTIPSQISKLFIIWLMLIIINIVLFFLASHFNILTESLNNKSKISFFAGLIIPLSWLAYFRWSKRVKAFYGANAFE